MKKTIKLVVFLAIVSALSGLCIGLVNSITEPIINENKIAAEKVNLEKMYPGAEFKSLDYSDEDGVIIGAYEVVSKGYIFKGKATGFNSSIDIIVLVGMDKNGTITNVIALQQSETKGFGSKCFDANNINNLYIGKKVNEEVDILSGATYTSNAMKEIMAKAQEAYGKVK